MTNHETSAPRAPRPPLPWVLILGLGSLALLWPLTSLTGLLGTGAPRALAILAVIGATWICVVGFGRVPRPVLVLTLTGIMYGAIGLILGALLPGEGGPFGDSMRLWVLAPALGLDAGVGALAGLAAWGIQSLRAGARS